MKDQKYYADRRKAKLTKRGLTLVTALLDHDAFAVIEKHRDPESLVFQPLAKAWRRTRVNEWLVHEFVLPIEIWKKIKSEAKKELVSASAMIRRILAAFQSDQLYEKSNDVLLAACDQYYENK
jgi:hypothetical protein